MIKFHWNKLELLNKSTAVLIFAQSSQKESEFKSFFKSAQLFSALNKQTFNTVIKSGLPYFHLSEKEQIGTTFSERFSNAIQHIYDLGYDNVISIGNDTPQLTVKHLLKTAEELQIKKVVLGPSLDGGFYLLGLNKTQFNKELFLQLPWQTVKLLQKISQNFSAKGIEFTILKKLQDIDTLKDVKQLVESFKTISDFIFQILLSIVYSKNKFQKEIIYFRSLLQKEMPFNKGSPVYL